MSRFGDVRAGRAKPRPAPFELTIDVYRDVRDQRNEALAKVDALESQLDAEKKRGEVLKAQLESLKTQNIALEARLLGAADSAAPTPEPARIVRRGRPPKRKTD